MGITWNEGARNNMSDPFNHYNGKIGIEIRGQSSQAFPMKSYSIELRNSSGNSQNKSLLGLPSESDWVLYAPYNDKTLMHNFLAYTISREMGHWAANCRYVEVILNGSYNGIYVLMEKIKRKASRVNISSMSDADNSDDAVTGGYIFSIDKEADGWFSKYAAGSGTVQFTYVYPKLSNITSQQKSYIQGYVDSFEYALHTTTYQDKTSGWRRFANESSFIDYFLVNEVSRNVDAYRLSSYFYKDRNSIDGKIKAGPVWDYDLAFRNANYCDGSNTAGWSYQFNTVCPSDYWQVPDWWNLLLADTAFQSNLYCRWQAFRSTTLSTSHLNFLVDSITALTSEARARHFQQWTVLGQYVWPNPEPIPATYAAEIDTLKNWLQARLQWIDDNLVKRGACVPYPENEKASYIVAGYQNPFTSTGKIVIQSRQSQDLTIMVYDMAGRKAGEYYIRVAPGYNSFTIPSHHWSKGMYVLQCINNNHEKTTRKVMKL